MSTWKSQSCVLTWRNPDFFTSFWRWVSSVEVNFECWVSGIFCPQCRVSGNVRCRNNPFHGPSRWTFYCVHCGPPVVLLQLPSYCLPTCCTCLESSLKLIDLDPLTYDLWHWPFESLTDSRFKMGIFKLLTLTYDLDLCDLDPHNIDLYVEPLILILGWNWNFSHFWPWWPWPSTYDLDQWWASRWHAYGSIKQVLAQ